MKKRRNFPVSLLSAFVLVFSCFANATVGAAEMSRNGIVASDVEKIAYTEMQATDTNSLF